MITLYIFQIRIRINDIIITFIVRTIRLLFALFILIFKILTKLLLMLKFEILKIFEFKLFTIRI